MVARHHGVPLAELWDLWRWGSGETLMAIGDDTDDFDARVREVLSEEAAAPESWWWLSYVEPDSTGHGVFQGVVIVRGSGLLTATIEANRLHISPGGEVFGEPMLDMPPAWMPYVNRLLSREDVEAMADVRRETS